jgi:hypothetical protein
MVRKNANPPQGKGFDPDKGTRLNDELDKAEKSTYETHYPAGEGGEPNKLPIDIRGDARPEKKG